VPVEPVHPPQEESVPEQSTKHPERHKHRHKHRKIGEQVAKSDTVVPTAPEKTEIIQPPQIKRKKGKEQVQASIETTENSQENSELKEFNLQKENNPFWKAQLKVAKRKKKTTTKRTRKKKTTT